MTGLLWSVSQNEQPELLREHLDAGNHPDAGEHGRTLLYIAASRNAGAVRLLLERGADPNHSDGINQQRPLHVAAQSKNVETARLLLDGGARVDVIDMAGNTPLHYAVNSQGVPARLDLVELLVERGAVPTARNDYGVAVDEMVEGPGVDVAIRDCIRSAVELRR